MRKLLLITLLFISSQTIFAQDNVGIGTLTPNANALVDMETNNKGLLIPRLSSAQRLAIPTAGVVDEALLVYDLDLDVFFYWDGGQWIGFPLDNDPTNELQDLVFSNDTLYISNGNSIYLGPGGSSADDQQLSINGDTLILEDGGFVLLNNLTNTTILSDSSFVLNGDTISFPTDNDTDPTNELQNLSFDTDSIYLSDGNAIAISSFTTTNLYNDTTFVINGDTIILPTPNAGTDDQNLTLSNDTLFIEDGNFVVLPSGVVNTDNQNITINGDTLILEDGGFILLGDLTNITNLGDTSLVLNGDTISFPADADTDPTNELQDLAVVGDSLIINGGTNVFLGDLTSSNIINDTTLIINGDTLTLPSGGGINTDDQNLTLSNDTLFIEDGNFVVLPSGVVNTDDQNITINGDTLILEDGGFILLGDLTNITNLGDTSLVLNGDTIAFSVDADTDPTNELQDLAVVGDSLIINGGTNVFLGDLTNTTNLGDSSFVVNGDTINLSNSGTDDQNLTGATLLGNTLTIDIEDGNSVSVDLGSLAAGLDSIYGQGDSLILVSNGGVDTAYVNLGSTTDTDDQTLTLSNDTLYIADGNFVVLTDNVNDADFDPTNELQNLGINGDSLTINGGTNISINDLSSSVVLNDSTIVVNGDTLIINGIAGVDTDDQTLSILGDQLTITDGNTITLPDNVNDADFDPTNELQDLGINGDSITINGGSSISINDISNSTVINDTTIVVNGDTLIINGSGGINTDNQNITINGDTLILEDGGFILLGDITNITNLGDTAIVLNGDTIDFPNDLDTDPTNELQDLAVVGDSLIINGGTNVYVGDLTNVANLGDSAFAINGDTVNLSNAGTDNQNLTGATLLGTTLTVDIEDGNSISVDLGSLAAGIDTIFGQGDSLILVSNGGVDTAYVNLGSTTDTDDQTLTLSNDTLYIADGNFVVLTDNVNDADFDPTNELQDLGINGDSLTINGGTSISINDLSSSTVLNDSTIVVNGDTLIINGIAGVDTDDQTLSILGDQLTITDGNTITLPDNVNDADFDPTNELQDLGINGDSITINGGTSISINDISNSIVLNDSTILVNGDTLIINGTAGTDTDDQFVDQLTLDGDTMLQISLDDDGVAPIELDLSPLLGDHNTLDEAYDEGGAGAGRTITATDGDVRIDGTDGLIVLGTFGSGQVLPALPVGSKMFFYPRKSAFRAGLVNGTQWNDANIGEYSFSGGRNNIASGDYSTAFGFNNSAVGPYSTTFGHTTTASGTGATSFGSVTSAQGPFSTAFGIQTQANGPYSAAFGTATQATSNNSAAFGTSSLASGSNATSFGNLTQATGLNSSAFGFGSEATDYNAVAFGLNTNATNSNTVAFGNQTAATATGASSFGQNSIASGRYSFSTGLFTLSRSYGEFVVGSFNTDYTPSSTISFDSTDRVFVVGNGNGVGTRSNAITTLKSGNTGFGDNASVPTNLIHLNNGVTDPLRIENLAIDATLDNVMVTDINGVVHIRDVSTIGGADTDDQFVDQLTLNGDTMLQISLDGDGMAPVELDLSALGDDWKLEGNAGTNPVDNFIGTTDAEELSIRTNNTEFLRVTNQGQLEVYNTGNSIFIGEQAGENDDLTNNINIAIGNNALAANDTGVYNVGIGFNSLQNNLASQNTAVGFNTLASNVSGRANSAFGFNALRVNTSGYDNTGVGFHALRFNTTGFGNTAFGRQSLALNETGFRNTAVGVLASGNNRASDNSSFGYTALRGNINGSGNVAFGNYAGVISQGDHNTYLGFRAGDSDSTAMENTYIGAYAGGGAWTGTFGTGAEQKSGNIFLGYRSGYDENGSNKLYIENSASTTPLIYGEFDNNLVKINGDLGVGAVVGAPTNTLHVNDGAIDPVRIENLDTDNTLDEILVQDATGVIHVRDASSLGVAGDITSVAAGDGLVGGGITGAVTLDVVATNGLTDNANDIRLGGTLVQATVIDQGVFPLDVNLDGTGDFSVQDAGVDVFQIRDNGNMNTGRDVYFRDIDINGTNLVSITDEGNDGRLQIYENGGVSVDLNANTEFIFNEQGIDRNFRVESNARQNMLFVDAGTNRVGIGVGVPLNELHVVAATVDPLRLDGLVTDATLDNVMVTDANGVVHIRDVSTIGGVDTQNTLDQAYDEGGPGAGRVIDASDGAVRINGEDGFIVTGTHASGDIIEVSGAGTRMFFNPNKSAFRAGMVINGLAPYADASLYWNNDSIGVFSFASGVNTRALGHSAVAMGNHSTARGDHSTVLGIYSTATGLYSTAIGNSNEASAQNSLAMGLLTNATGSASTAMGNNTTASGNSSTAMGNSTVASGDYSIAMGRGSIASGNYSFAAGQNNTTANNFSAAFGFGNTVNSGSSFSAGRLNTNSNVQTTTFGLENIASGTQSTAIGNRNHAQGTVSTAIGQGLISQHWGEFAAGTYNDTVLAPNQGGTRFLTDRIFVVGDGFNAATRSNAITTLLNGRTGFGNDATFPSNLVHLNNGAIDPLRIENLVTDNTLDEVLVQDANGVIHVRDASTIGGVDTDDQFVDQLSLNGDTMLQISLDGDGIAPVELDLSALGDDWKLEGNTGTDTATNFIGTTDNMPLRFKLNNLYAGQIDIDQNNFFFGENAGVNATNESQNIAIGNYALSGPINNGNNIAIGSNSMRDNALGTSNTAVGNYSLHLNSTGGQNAAFGGGALRNGTNLTGNSAFGNLAGVNIQGDYNAVFGYRSMFASGNSSSNTTNNNTSIGSNALRLARNSSDNVALGFQAGSSDTLSNQNVYLGAYSGAGIAIGTPLFLDSEVKSGNVFIGYRSGFNATGDNKLVIENSDANDEDALIYGEFDNDILKLNGSVGVGVGFTGNPTNGLHVNTGAIDPLRIENLATDNTLDEILVQDASGVVHVRDASTIGNAGDVTAIIAGTGLTGGGGAGALTVNAVGDNGLTTNANDIDLGGALNQNTTFTYGNFDMIHNLNSGASDFRIQDNGVDHFQVSSTGNINTGGNVFFNFGSTTGTPLASLVADANDGRFRLYENGLTQIDLDANSGVVFNEQGSFRNFRIESATNSNMFFVNGISNRIGINTGAPTAQLSVLGIANKSGGGAWAVFSDRRLKKDISDYKEGLNLITKVRTVNFTYNDKMDEVFGSNPETKDKVYQGVIAQELQKIAPDMVREVSVGEAQNPEDENYDPGKIVNEETFLEVDPNKFTYALINAVQEQQEMILDMGADLENLKANRAMSSIQKVPNNMQLLVESSLAEMKDENEFLKAEIDKLKEANDSLKARLENIENILEELVNTNDN